MSPASRADVLSIDRCVPHVSTVHASQGQTVGLMLHGGFAPSIVAYDLRHSDYSHMEQMARAGFDVFTFSQAGCAPSPRPRMDDPVNVDAAFQQHLVPHLMSGPHAPRYPFKLVSSRTEWDEIDTVVDFIRELRGSPRRCSTSSRGPCVRW